MTILSPTEARTFLAAVAGDPLEALYVLAITTGMEQGEILGLHWRNVDIERRSVEVCSSLQRGAFVEPKTAGSRRQVALTEVAVLALRRHQGYAGGTYGGPTGATSKRVVYENHRAIL